MLRLDGADERERSAGRDTKLSEASEFENDMYSESPSLALAVRSSLLCRLFLSFPPPLLVTPPLVPEPEPEVPFDLPSELLPFADTEAVALESTVLEPETVGVRTQSVRPFEVQVASLPRGVTFTESVLPPAPTETSATTISASPFATGAPGPVALGTKTDNAEGPAETGGANTGADSMDGPVQPLAAQGKWWSFAWTDSY